MEACSYRRSGFKLAVLILICVSGFANFAACQTHRIDSKNFVVIAANAQLAKKTAILAEQYRKDLSIQWLGYEIGQWVERCPIYVEVGPHARGETSFAFVTGAAGKSEPVAWEMKIFGPVDRLLDAVLPHEITHTLFATHFGQPLPRWADEGACTIVEHESERMKNHQMLIEFLSARPSRGIPFNRMFPMRQYPVDILALYAQGHSVARYLIEQKGKQHFVKFIETGLAQERSQSDTAAWDLAINKHYGYQNLSDLQLSWQQWVRSGSPKQQPNDIALVAKEDRARNSVNLLDPQSTYAIASKNRGDSQPSNTRGATLTQSPQAGSWYARESRAKQAVNLPLKKTAPSPSTAHLKTPPPQNPIPFLPGSLKRQDRGNISDLRLPQKSGDKILENRGTLWR